MKTIFTSLLLFVALASFGQNTFKTRVFAENDNYLNQIVQLNDGSFISIGYVYIENAGHDDAMLLVKTKADGTVVASKAFTTGDYDEGLSVAKTNDGGFVVAGFINDQMGIVKCKADLTVEWQKEYRAKTSTGAWKILQTPDGGYMLAGGVYEESLDGIAGYIVRTDSDGEVIWSKQYMEYWDNRLLDMVATKDGNYAFLAVTNWDDNNLDTTYVVKIKTDGSIIWSKHFYNDTLFTEPNALIAASDGGLVVTGGAEVVGSNSSNEEMMMLKFDNSGNLLWSNRIESADNSSSFAYSVTEDTDGGYLFVGDFAENTNNEDTYARYAYVVKTNSTGSLQWTKTFEKGNEDGYTNFTNVIRTIDGGYAVCGFGSYLEENDYVYGVDIYKFNNSFEICGETAGSKGSGKAFGTSKSESIYTTDLNTITDNLPVNSTDAYSNIDYPCSTLPLQLLSFNATLQNKTVALQWTTANEVNTSSFTVERSKDAVAFKALQTVPAKGNSAGVQSYNTTDFQPLQGTSYYRLQQADKDGKTTYSSVVPVTVLSNGMIVISLNPVRNEIRVVVQSAANSNLILQVLDMKGKVLATQKASVVEGRNTVTIPAASLAKGIYLLKVIQNHTTETIRFMKE